ncbi:MAG: DUF72 domain-containing protein [Endomicrobia bacterium]|nr:DUF72 domain-containing protein [Endomicrobiia bacterium]
MTKIIKVGCCGFPVSQKKYYKEFSCIEINSSFYQVPSIEIAKRWLKEAKSINPDFEFIIKAWQIITHKSSSLTYRRIKQYIGNKKNYGFFAPTQEVFTAWDVTKEFALAISAKKILFQCPSSFLPTEENLRNLYTFFKKIKRDKEKYKFEFIIEVRAKEWSRKIISKISKELDLTHCVDPLYNECYAGNYNYFRLHGIHINNKLNYNYKFSDEELKKIFLLCNKKLNYVMFNNSTMYEDANRFKILVEKGF